MVYGMIALPHPICCDSICVLRYMFRKFNEHIFEFVGILLKSDLSSSSKQIMVDTGPQNYFLMVI